MAQNIMVCQFCEISTVLKWKCINCDLILCHKCSTKIHSKGKLKEHEIIYLKEFNSTSAVETIRFLDVRNIQCTRHADEKCEIYCKDCDMLLCSSCMMASYSNHPNHKFEKIADVYQQKLQQLKEIQVKWDLTMMSFSDTEIELDAILTKGTTQYEEIKQVILKTETEIKNDLTKQSENLVKELDKLWKPKKDKIYQKLSEIKEKKGDLLEKLSKIEEILLSHEAMSIFRASDTRKNDPPVMPTETAISHKKIILSQSTPMDNIISLGSLRTVPELKVIGSYQTILCSISRIITTDDGTNIFSSFYNNIIGKFELKDSKCLTTAVVEKIEVTDMAITKQGKLLFSTYDCSEVKYLKSLSPDTTVETLTSISPLGVSAIHATDKNILIGFFDNGKIFPLTPSSRRGIIVQDYNGRHIRTLECDNNNDRIFSSVHKIKININNDICVIDREGIGFKATVAVLTWLGSVKWKYTGHSSINYQYNRQFSPCDLVTTDEGFILVTDHYCDAIHMLSIDGNLLTCLTDTHGIKRPLSLHIDKSGQLLVGCWKIGYLAELHIVQMNTLN